MDTRKIAVIILKFKQSDFTIQKGAMSWENLFLLYVNNKGAFQQSDSTFVVRRLDSIYLYLLYPKFQDPG